MADAATTGHASQGDFDRVLVVDFGAQYAQLIARRVREARVFSEIVPRDVSAAEVAEKHPVGIILSGGPTSVYAEDAFGFDEAILELGIPVLGICYGHQVLAQALGGMVVSTGTSEFGPATLTISDSSGIFSGRHENRQVWMSHNDAVSVPPEGFVVTASTPDAPVAAMENPGGKMYGVQFHPEVGHTDHGQEVLEHFLWRVCDARPTWTHAGIIERSIDAIRTTVGDGIAICGLSGGVDSSVAAALAHRAVGDQLMCVFVDHGLMREGEGDQVEETFRDHFKMNLIHVKAEDRFLDALAGVTDPEEKRKIIGETFIRVFEEVAADIDGAHYLVQGTLYPDVIESGTKDAAKIKSHHNVGGLPDDMQFELVEPLRDLFKDEVRAVGEELGLPDEIVWRQPFPGPGLAVRIIGDITKERLDILRAADVIVLDEIRKAGLHDEIWQAFGVLPTIRSVGVQGDGRTYAYPLIVRAVASDDAMTADWVRLPYEVLAAISSRVINEVADINRVAYDISSKPPATIEWE
ncbi:MAG: glutamine-hydrolyzing GMP synthase [Acidimicrobiia bacterium]|nr:MAG: glutamine-hydrolyzing GMP synthase [Acidimicrobiia bacterium]